MDTNNNSIKPTTHVALDLRWVAGALLIIIVVLLALWRPWQGTASEDQTIQVTGETTVTAVPDEFVFYPTYQFKASDNAAALTALAKKSDEVTAKLKELGVPENKIKTNSSGYGTSLMPTGGGSDKTTYTLQLTVTVDNQELAQKVQDYLLTTEPTGSVSPQPTFSDTKQRELEAEARDKATVDARAKAEQSAKNLGFRLGKVKSVNDGDSYWTTPLGGRAASSDLATSSNNLGLYPGENELPYSVTVIYYIR
jgi:uncharacterized protein